MPKKLMTMLSLAAAVLLMTAVGAYAEATPRRIISLAPNITEILFALDLGDRIVGVTDFCDYPAEAKKKQKIGGMSNPSLEAVVSLKPDLVILTTDGNPKEFEDRLRSLGIKTYVFTARRIAELPAGIRELGRALGIGERAEAFASRFDASVKRLALHRSGGGKRPTVLFVVWPEPLMVAGPGTVIDDAIALIGLRNVAAKTGLAYPKYSIEEIIRTPPDIIIFGNMSTDTKKSTAGLLKRLKTVPAVKSNRVYYVNDDLYRLGPRTVRGIEELSRLAGDRP